MLAKEAKVSALTIHSYVESVREQYPDLAERLAPEVSSMVDDVESSTDEKKSTRRTGGRRPLLFPEHKPMSELTAGIRQGRSVSNRMYDFCASISCIVHCSYFSLLSMLECFNHLIHTCRYFQGALRAERGGCNRCYVVAQGMQVSKCFDTQNLLASTYL